MRLENQYSMRVRRRLSDMPDSRYLQYLKDIRDPDLDSRILVEIPAYCDPELIPTMRAAVMQSANPARVRFAVCYQGDDDAEFAEVAGFARTRTVRFAKKDAPGLCAARYACHGLRDGEEFIMRVDSHMRFATGWDVALIDQWRRCGDGPHVLSEYCLDCSGMITGLLSSGAFDAKAQIRAANVNASYFSNNSVKLRFTPRSYVPGPEPAKGLFIGGHFVFGLSGIDDDVPSDPDMFFTADEVCVAARLYTHGYEVYHPGVRCVYHVFSRNKTYESVKGVKALRFTSDDGTADTSARRSTELLRMEQLLGHTDHGIDFGVFGHGTAHTIDEFMDAAGVDFRTLSFNWRAYHEAYAAPETPLSRRPACVNGQIVVDDTCKASSLAVPKRVAEGFRRAAMSAGMPFDEALASAVSTYIGGDAR